MTTLNELMGIAGGGKILGPSVTVPFFVSGTWTAPQDGYAVLRAMGAGGSGAKGSGVATGGYSGAWGAKIVAVVKGQVITVALGAAGASQVTANTSGIAGGNTTITHNGVTRTAAGGPGGVYGAYPVTVPNGPAWSTTDWDIGANSVAPGNPTGNARTGGAGVDILAQGGNATASDLAASSGGGGTGGKSSGTTGGGALPGGLSAMGQLATTIGMYSPSDISGWGISFYGGGGGAGGPIAYQGANGGGGGGNNNSGAGGNGGPGGGGGAGIGSGVGGTGGYGGGGGGSVTGNSGPGGNGFACLEFFADMGL